MTIVSATEINLDLELLCLLSPRWLPLVSVAADLGLTLAEARAVCQRWRQRGYGVQTTQGPDPGVRVNPPDWMMVRDRAQRYWSETYDE